MKKVQILWLGFLLLLALPSLAQNLALNKASYASSAGQPAANAFDGNGNTRWESAFSDPQYIIVDLGSVQTIDRIRLTWENAYGKDFTLAVSTVTAAPSNATWSNVTGGSWTTVKTVTGNNTTSNEYPNLAASGRYVRLYGTARATGYGYSLYEFEVFNYSYNTANNLALKKPAFASSTEGSYVAKQAFDNDNSTRWGSSFADNQWVYVDLQGQGSIQKVYLSWETAYGKDFRIEVSNDASTWTTVSTTTGNTLHYNEISFSPAVSGRYVRMYGAARGTGYGFSLYEFQVYGTLTPLTAPLPVSLALFSASTQARGVALRWITASEQNNNGFEVQRSANGLDYATLAFVKGAGNSTAVTAYAYLDATPLAATAYYRLRQVDYNGKATFSAVVSVAAVAAAQRVQPSAYPNPATGSTTLAWPAASAGPVRLTLCNAAGQVLHTELLAAQAGSNTQPLDLSAYPAGTYLLTLVAAGEAPRHTRLEVR